MAAEQPKPPIINCHVHVFTGKHVPKHLAKSILPWQTYRLLNFNLVFRTVNWWYAKGPGSWTMKPWYKKLVRGWYRFQMLLSRSRILSILSFLLGAFLMLQFIDWVAHGQFQGKDYKQWWMRDVLIPLHHWLEKVYFLPHVEQTSLKVLMAVILFLFFRSGRNLMLFVARSTVKWLGKIPGKQTSEIFLRYLTIGRFTIHNNQGTVLGQLQRQYPDGSGFLVLPMDMAFMGAGSVRESYEEQMDKLAALKEEGNNIYPFVFVDPRRMDKDPNFFKYSLQGQKIILEDCFIRTYIQSKGFSGFKIYPALGYYPFDDRLLPLWKYAEQNDLPVLTHCVKGPMYYRETKKPEWDAHPVFRQAMGGGSYEPLLLPERKNDAFSANFTHPMNFLCLLKDNFLAEVVDAAYKKQGSDPRLKLIFGLTESSEKMVNNKKERIPPQVSNGLGDLKICLAHYGGADEWEKYFEKDRFGHSNELIQKPDTGIDFLHLKGTTTPSPGKPEQLWKFTDWYSIISSMMLQHPNVYADISYILHDAAGMLPLLKQTLQNPKLRTKVLYGTDFYVVRNHKSDKNMLADMQGGLSEADFDQIARVNPVDFLNLRKPARAEEPQQPIAATGK